MTTQLRFHFEFPSRPPIRWRPPRGPRSRIHRCGVCAAKWPAFFDVPDSVCGGITFRRISAGISSVSTAGESWSLRRTMAPFSAGAAGRWRCGARHGGSGMGSRRTSRSTRSGSICGGMASWRVFRTDPFVRCLFAGGSALSFNSAIVSLTARRGRDVPCRKPSLRSGLQDFCSWRAPRPRPPQSLCRPPRP